MCGAISNIQLSNCYVNTWMNNVITFDEDEGVGFLESEQ